MQRFWSVDPLTRDYPFLTPYQYASNRPIDGVDLDGLEFLKTIPEFESSGSNFDYVTEIDNAVIRILNLPMTTWNSAVANYQSAKRGTWKQDVKAEAKQMGEGIKSTAKQFYHAPITTLTSPKAVGMYTEAIIGGKAFSLAPNSRNLLKPNTALKASANSETLLTARAKVFSEGGSIELLEGQGKLTINASSKRLTGELNINNKSIFIEGQVSTENGVLSIKDLSIRNKAGNYNNADLVNEVGFGPFKNLIDELKQLREKGGYKKGELEFERMRTDKSKLPDSEKRTIEF